MSRAAFEDALTRSAERGLAGRKPSAADVERYLRSLHVDDLALACACAAGMDAAWEHFVRTYGPALTRAADAIDPTGRARELAEGLHADLFGLRETGGQRQSLFRYFHGRSSLGTWLRAVLAQRHVDGLRATKRLDPLPEDESPSALPAASDPPSESPRFAAALQSALSSAVATLEPRDRLRLGCYYAQQLSLAEIGRMLGEHEATVSRHLTRTRQRLRIAIEEQLRKDHGLDAAAIAECVRALADDAGPLDLGRALQAGGGKTPAVDRSR